MVRVIVGLAIAAVAVRGLADPTPRLVVAVQQRAEVAPIVLRNTGDCTLASVWP
jgi:hypothetical protein